MYSFRNAQWTESLIYFFRRTNSMLFSIRQVFFGWIIPTRHLQFSQNFRRLGCRLSNELCMRTGWPRTWKSSYLDNTLKFFQSTTPQSTRLNAFAEFNLCRLCYLAKFNENLEGLHYWKAFCLSYIENVKWACVLIDRTQSTQLFSSLMYIIPLLMYVLTFVIERNQPKWSLF